MLQIPDPDDVLADLASITPLLYRAVGAGAQEARSYFFQAGTDVDPYLFCHIVRFHAKHTLEAEGYPVVEDLEIEDLANSGLSMTVAGYAIKIRKGDRGQVPAPQSQSLFDFYVQQQLKLSFPGDGTAKPNLVVLWDVDRPAYEMSKTMVLACPSGVYRSDVACHWKVPIPMTTTVLSPRRRIVTEPVEDLDAIQPLERAEEQRKRDDAG